MRGRKLLVNSGEKYGRLTIIEEVQFHTQPNGKIDRQFRCICECGNEKIIKLNNLRSGSTISCGCFQKEFLSKRVKTHGCWKHPIYQTWSSMKNRCLNLNHKNYKDYGGRGIKVCDRWLNSFANFLEDMGERPTGMSIDRINNDGNYEPSNCRWATDEEQNKNRRPKTKSVKS